MPIRTTAAVTAMAVVVSALAALCDGLGLMVPGERVTVAVGVYVACGEAPGSAGGVVIVVWSRVIAAMRASRRPVMAALLPTTMLWSAIMVPWNAALAPT